MKVIVAGSLTFEDYQLLKKTMDELVNGHDDVTVLSGTADGADKLGEQWAFSRCYTVRRFHPDWKRYGKAAGPIRNHLMVMEADTLVAFWDGKSRGTASIIRLARSNGLTVKIVAF